MIKSLLGNPWTLVVVAAVAFGGGAYTAHQFSEADKVDALEEQLKAVNARYAERDQQAIALQTRDQKLSKDNSELIDLNARLGGRLSIALNNPTIKYITREGSSDATNCRDTRRTPAFRLCWNAAVLGTAEGISACEAAGVNGAVPSEPLPAR